MAIYRVTFQTELLIDCENEAEAEEIGYDNIDYEVRNGVCDIVSMKLVDSVRQLHRGEHNSLPWRANSRNCSHEPEKTVQQILEEKPV